MIVATRAALGDRIESVEVDDMIRYHAEVTAENWGAQATSLLV